MADTPEKEVGIADSAWREWANAAFSSLGYGAQKRCSDETGVPAPDINKLLKGITRCSEHQPIVTDWLLAQGSGSPTSEQIRYLYAVLRRLPPEDVDAIAKIARKMDPRRR